MKDRLDYSREVGVIRFDLVLETYRDDFVACKDLELHDKEYIEILDMT